MPSEVNVEQKIADARAAMAEYGGVKDSPPVRVCNALLDLSAGLKATIDRLQAPPTEEILRLLRGELSTIKPEFAAHWTWRKVAAAVVAGIACLTLVSGVSATVAGHLGWEYGHDVGASESQRWFAYCGDDHNVHAGFCWVPVRPVEVKR